MKNIEADDMKKVLVFIFINLCIYGNVYAKKNILNLVTVSDSITMVLDNAYYTLTKRHKVNAGVNIHNVISYKKTKFENGLYSFGGMGPHFPKILFIHYNSKLYIISAKTVPKVLQQLADAYYLLHIKKQDHLLYVKSVLTFLDNCLDDKYSYYGYE